MRLQTKATSILETTAQLIRAGRGSTRNKLGAINEPSWYRVVASHPPTTNLALKAHHLEEYINQEQKFKVGEERRSRGTYVTRNKQGFSVKPQHLYRPKLIRFVEDKIRQLFYDQHPWELARPKLVVENDGKDAARIKDWSSIYQKNKKLDGESVVQRTLYLISSGAYQPQDWLKAYDQARVEFYRLRMREEAETQVAAEEAAMFGSVFGKSYIQHGVEQEQKVIDKWVDEAIEATKVKKSKFTDTADAAPEEDSPAEALEPEQQQLP